jgi:hypothetical protein
LSSLSAALPGSSNPVAENADLARQKIGQKAEGLKEDIKDTTNTNKGLFGSVKSSVQSGVDQVGCPFKPPQLLAECQLRTRRMSTSKFVKDSAGMQGSRSLFTHLDCLLTDAEQVKEAADSVTSANPLKRTAYESNGETGNF